VSRRFLRFVSAPVPPARPLPATSGLHKRTESTGSSNRDADRIAPRAAGVGTRSSPGSSASWDASALSGRRTSANSGGRDTLARTPTNAVRHLVRISLDAGSELVESVHQFVTTYAGTRFGPSMAQAVAVASYELLSNGLKYASLFEPVIYELNDDGQAPEVHVSNAAVQSRINVLVEWVDQVNRDPQTVYLEEMRRSLSGSQRATLGLARVAHEAGMSVTVLVDGSRVSVRARSRR
jgi:hypothetical protein